MIPFILEAEKLTLSQKFLEGGKVLLIGICTVFAVLSIIWFCLYLVRLLMERITPSGKQAPAPAPAPAPVVPITVTPVSAEGELIAVIAAAIAAAEAESGKTGFRVVSFHRVNK